MTRIERFLSKHVLLTDIIFFAIMSTIGAAMSLTVIALIAILVVVLI